MKEAEAERFFYGFENHFFDMGLDNLRKFMQTLGNPQDKVKVIHVAGTNGKGSVSSFIAEILTEAGFKTGRYHSPAVFEKREIIAVDGKLISGEEFAIQVELMKSAVEIADKEGRLPTIFELETALAYQYFAYSQCDFAVIECGMGGLTDATNITNSVVLSVFTSISMDHIQYLGDTVEAIAGEKAGIIKKGIPVIYDANRHETAQVIEETAQRVGAPAYPVRREDFEIREITSSGIEFSYGKTDGRQQEYSIPFIARYQVMNSALALKTLEVLREQQDFTALTDSQVKAGIGGTRWQGRMETIQPGVIVDGAHNEDGVANFIETAVYFRDKYRIVLLFSAVDDKDYPHMIRRICSELRPAQVVTATIQEERAVDAQVLAQEFRKNGCTCVQAENSVKEAFQQAAELRGDGLLFCIGSLYLIGEIKSLI